MTPDDLLAKKVKPMRDLVRVNIKHQYPGGSSSGQTRLDSKEPSFFERAKESIIGPLSAELAKSWGPR